MALDLSGRPFLAYTIEFATGHRRPRIPPFDPQLAEEFWRAFATAAGLTLHVRLVTGKNTHHILEASFKAVARSLLKRRGAHRGRGRPVHQGHAVTPPAP